MGAVLKIPTLTVTPSEKPFQGRGKPDKILRNGRPGGTLEQQLLQRGRGGHQTKVITKAFSREQKRSVAGNAAIGAGLTAAVNPGLVKRGVQYSAAGAGLKRAAKKTTDVAGKGQYLVDAQRLSGIGRRNLGRVGGAMAVGAGFGAGVSAIGAANQNRKMRRAFADVAKMSDTELRRRKKLAGHIAVTTSTLGLGSLGALGAGAALKKPRLTKLAATGSIVSGGIGGAGGYNYAAIQRAEAKRRPVNKAFDAERSRHQRARRQTQAAATVSAGSALGAGYAGYKGLKNDKLARAHAYASGAKVQDGWYDSTMAQTSNVPFRSRSKGKTKLGNYDKPYFRPPTSGERLVNGGTAAGKLRKVARKNFKVAGGLAALGAGGAVAADRIASYNAGKGRTYAPRHRRPE